MSVEQDDDARETPETVASALEDVTDESLGISESDDDAGETDDGGGVTAAAEDEGSGLNEDGTPDALQLSAEDIAVIRSDPRLMRVWKSMNRGVTQKFQTAGEAMRLVQAYEADPVRFIHALAQANGFDITRPNTRAAQDKNDAAMDQVEAELQTLFGPEAAARVRGVFERLADQRAQSTVAPFRQFVHQYQVQAEATRMAGEEHAFKARHADLTAAEEREVVALGNSGRFTPGSLSPAEYLESLLQVARARRGVGNASQRLAKRISANRSDREPTGVSARGPVRQMSRVKPTMSISQALDEAAAELDEEG